MANQRTFLAQGLSLNGVAVGGLASMAFNAAYRSVVESRSDGAIGSEDVDRAGLDADVAIECTDVSKVNAILAATPGTTTWSGKESGAATWHNYSIGAGGVIVITGARLNFPKGADATLSLTGKLRFGASATELDGVIALTGAGGAAPTLTYPARLYRPTTASFDPDGAATAIAPLHIESLSLSLDAQVIQDFADADVGHTAVDIVGWQPLRTSLTHRDAKAVSPSNINAQILKAVRGVLIVTLLGRGGAANQTLTVNNLLFTGSSHRDQAEYSEFTLNGSSGWKNGATVYTLNGSPKLFSFA